MQTAPDLLDPVFFSRLDSIELRARGIVEGFLQGLHRSPFVGYSVEFASHREYVPGDDLRHVNWKLFARQKRLYVKEFDAETNLNLYLLLDISRSMECATPGWSKLLYVQALAAALAHLALKQRDAVGVTVFADRVLAHLEPKARPQQRDEILRTIANIGERPASRHERALAQAVELARHRGLVVILSDFFDDIEPLTKCLEQLRFRHHEVLLLHVMDPIERWLSIDGHLRFRDLETGSEIVAQSETIRQQYQNRVNAFCEEIEQECLSRGVERIELTTDQPVSEALIGYLVQRARVT